MARGLPLWCAGGETSAQVETVVIYPNGGLIAAGYSGDFEKYWTTLGVAAKVRTRLVSKEH
jgi:hypothetical protein